MSDSVPARFRKTKNDKWAVMAPVADLEKALAGDGKVDVLKRSGDWSSFTVASLGKPFDVDGVMMCYGYGPEDDDDQARSGQGSSRQSSAPSAPARRQSPPPARDYGNAPGTDPSEPLPEFKGGAEDEWVEF